MIMLQLKLCYLLVLISNACYAAKILGIFPITGKSHFTTDHAIMKSLIEAGHQVTVVTPFVDHATSANYTSIIDSSENEFFFINNSFQDYAKLTIYEMIKLVYDSEKSYCNNIMKLPEIRNMLTSEEKLFDVMFVEILTHYKCYFPIAKKMNIPVIGIATFRSLLNADQAISNPNHLAYIPFEGTTAWQSPDEFYSRMRNVWDFVLYKIGSYLVNKSFLPQFHQHNIDILGSNVEYFDIEPALVFYNNHPSYLPRPMNPNAIDIGGISLTEAKPLPKDIEKFIEEAEHGVILFSFGSVTRAALLPTEIKNSFKDAFAEIPQRVIWKFEEKMENLSSNVMLMEWLPQRDILEHKNVKAFISHCGQGGTYEAIYTATPVLAISLFGDQHGNAALLKGLGVAIRLDINYLSKEIILNALNSIINDTRYNDNMQKLSDAFKDRPMTPQQNVVYWTEYVIRHNGAPHLKTFATQLNWFQYFLLDVLGFVTISTVFILYFVFRFFKILNHHFYEMKKKYQNSYKNKDI